MALNLNRAKPAASQSDGDQSTPPPIKRPTASRPSNSVIHTPTGFVLATPTDRRRLIINAEGEEKSGKNHFAFTAPGPIFEHSFDIGNEGVVDKFLGKKAIHIAEYELELQPSEGSAQEVADAADRVWSNFISNYKDGLASCGNGTTLIDTGTEMWELLRLARFGKLTQVMPHHYGPVNKEMQEAIREGFGFKATVIFLHKQKDEWENYTDSSGKEKGKKTGRKVRVGFNDMPFLVQVNLQCRREDNDGGGSEFYIDVQDCRQNPDLNGMTLPNDYDTLADLIFG